MATVVVVSVADAVRHGQCEPVPVEVVRHFDDELADRAEVPSIRFVLELVAPRRRRTRLDLPQAQRRRRDVRRAHRTTHGQTCANTSYKPCAMTLALSNSLHRV